MKKMSFYTPEGFIARVGETKDDKGMLCYTTFIGKDPMEGVKLELTYLRAENTIKTIAKNMQWVPCSVKDAVDDKTKCGLQGPVRNVKVYLNLPSEEVVIKKQQYINLDMELIELENCFEAEVKAMRADHKDEVAKLVLAKKKLEYAACKGLEEKEVEASWERDIEEELSYSVNRETLAFIDVRDMTPEERNPELFDGPKIDPEEDEFDDEEDEEYFDKLHKEDAVEEIIPDLE